MILKRCTTLKCDVCAATETVEHDLAFSGDSGYGFNSAVSKAGWFDVWVDNLQGYGHLCPGCGKKRTEALAVARQRRDAKLKKRRGHG